MREQALRVDGFTFTGQKSASTHISFKVFKSEFVGFVEKLCPVHVAGVQDDVCSLRHPVAVYDVIRQSSAHGEVHHRVEPQALVDEALQHMQLLRVPVLKLPLTYSKTMVKMS